MTIPHKHLLGIRELREELAAKVNGLTKQDLLFVAQRYQGYVDALDYFHPTETSLEEKVIPEEAEFTANHEELFYRLDFEKDEDGYEHESFSPVYAVRTSYVQRLELNLIATKKEIDELKSKNF